MTEHEISLLIKGPTFCPTTRTTFLDSKADIPEFTRKLKLREVFWESDYTNDSLVKGKSIKAIATKDNDLKKIIKEMENIDPTPTKRDENLTKEQREALKNLKSYSDIVIKKADKGGMLVIMDAEFYCNKMVLADHLSDEDTYEQVPSTNDAKVCKNLLLLTKKHEKCLRNQESSYINNKDWRSSNLYVTPKVHKNKTIIEAVKESNCDYIHIPTPPDLKGRPIVAGPASPTQRLSEMLEKILSPLVVHIQSYIKDDLDFVRKLPRTIDFDCELYACDIVSLYTSIPHDLGIEAISYWVDRCRVLIPTRFTKEFIIESVFFVLNNNNFFFLETLWHQIKGSAMGTKFAPPYACLVVGFLEETKLYQELPRHFPPTYVEIIIKWFMRYIDDGFIMWPKILDIKVFISILGNLHPQIKFTIEAAKIASEDAQELPFLDVLVILAQLRVFSTDIFYKETNSHFYLDYNSHHPQHVKDNIPFTLAKKIVMFCSNPEKETARLEELRGWLIECNYPKDVIKRGLHNAQLQGPAPPPKATRDKLIFITTYSSNYTHDNTIQQINNLLRSPKTKKLDEIFENCTTTVAYKQPYNLLRHLTKAAFTSILPPTISSQKPNGFFKCNRENCKICKLYVQECSSFTTYNGVNWEIKNHISCNSKNVIYYLKCIPCNLKTTNIGKTNDLRLRTNNHISSCKSGKGTNKFDNHVFECRTKNNCNEEPWFEMYAFMTVNDVYALETYETFLHNKGYDSMNKR